MAVNLTEDLQRGMDALVNCTICTEPFTNPKVLPCQHTFCLGCLNQFFECYNQQRIIKMTNFPCPQCRKITYLSQGGMEALPKDFKVGQIQDFLGKVGIASKSRTDICDICKYEQKQRDAKQFCVQCSKYLCEQCMVHHRESSLFLTHSVMDIASTDVSVLECKEHKEEIKYFCVPCSLALCTVCALGRHSKHDTMDVTTALDQKRQVIEDLLGDARQLTQQFEQKAQELESLKQSRERHFSNTQTDIKKHVEELVDNIREQESQLLKQLEKNHSEAMKLIQKDAEQIKTQSTSIVSWIDSSTELLNPSKSLQLLAAQEHLINKMSKVCQTALPSAADRVREGPKFQPGCEASIGQMVVSSLTEEQAEVKEAGLYAQQLSPSPRHKTRQDIKQEAKKEGSDSSRDSSPLRPMPRPAQQPSQRSQSRAATAGGDRSPQRLARALSGDNSTLHHSARPVKEHKHKASSGETSPQRYARPTSESTSTSSRRASAPLSRDTGRLRSPLSSVGESPKSAPPIPEPTARTPLSPRGRPATSSTPTDTDTRKPFPLLGRSTSLRDIHSRPPTARELTAGTALRRSTRNTVLQQRQQPLKHTAKLKFRTTEYAGTRGVAFTPDGLIVTAEHEDNSDKIEMFDSTGEIKKWMMTGSCSVIKPWGITVNNQTSAIIVTDHGDSSVKVLDTDLTVRNMWRLHFSKPCGIAVMRTGDYVISDIGERAFKISIHTPSGLKVQEFAPHGTSDGHLLRPQYVAVDHHDRILVSDCDATCVKIFDRSGKQLSCFSNTDESRLNMFPQGLCVDASNHILLADQSYSGISMYSSDGKFIQHITKLDNPPWDVTVHESGLMAVGTDPSLRVYTVPSMES